MKKTVTIIFLSLIFLNQVGYYFSYLIQQEIIKESVTAQLLANLPDEVFEVVIADEKNEAFSWKENGKEFTLNGELFDVAKTKQQNGKTILLAVKDVKEDALIKQFVKDVNNIADNKPQGKSGKLLLKFQINDLIPFYENKASLFFQPVSKRYVHFNIRIVSEIPGITPPPPRC